MAEAAFGTAAAATDLLVEARESIDTLLGDWAEHLQSQLGGRNGQALAYALRTPGKRVRAALLIGAYRCFGGHSSGIAGVAAAVEVVHAYSLVHDDLPCMDDDDLRRGRPTAHRAFDIPRATEAGYEMVALAARVLAHGLAQMNLSETRRREIALELFRAAGAGGMIGGQALDLEAETKTLPVAELEEVHRRKTGALIAASCVIGGLSADASPGHVAGLRAYGEAIGLAFQIADDVLDAT